MILIAQFFLCKRKFFREKVMHTTMLIRCDQEGIWKIDSLSNRGFRLNLISTLSEARARSMYFQILLDQTLHAKENGFFIRGRNEDTKY